MLLRTTIIYIKLEGRLQVHNIGHVTRATQRFFNDVTWDIYGCEALGEELSNAQ